MRCLEPGHCDSKATDFAIVDAEAVVGAVVPDSAVAVVRCNCRLSSYRFEQQWVEQQLA